MSWVYVFSRTNTLEVKPGNPATVLLLQKLHCHPYERLATFTIEEADGLDRETYITGSAQFTRTFS